MKPKPTWLYRQSGVIPYRFESGQLEVLLITSQSAGKWIIPKGVIERFMSAADSAAKEAYEEAGVRGVVSKESVGSYDYNKWGGTCHVEVFLLAVNKILDEYPESQVRQRQWFALDEAVAKVTPEEVGPMISALPQRIDPKSGPVTR